MSKNDGLFSLIFVFEYNECKAGSEEQIYVGMPTFSAMLTSDIYELQKKIETARHELDEALLQENRFEYYYEKSTRLDKLIEEYLESQEGVRV